MSNVRLNPPPLRRHKPSHQGVVSLNGRDHYLGSWPDGQRKPPPSVQAAYDRLIAEWLANGRRLPTPAPNLTITELILAFWRWAERHYRHADGSPTGKLDDQRLSLGPLRDLFGELPVEQFSPNKLKAVRQRMIDNDLCRRVVNQRIGRVVRMFRWAVAEEMVKAMVYHALKAVPGLQRGRSAARETDPVKPVAVEMVEATLPHLLPEVADMVRLQLLTGMRPGELVTIRPVDIDLSGSVWIYRPTHHKTAHRGHHRVIPIGPRGQAVLRTYWDVVPMGDFVFSPRRSLVAKKGRMRTARKSRVQPSQTSRAKARPKVGPGERYTVNTYAQAIRRACLNAFPPPSPLARRPDETAREWKERLTPEQQAELRAWRQSHHWHPHRLRHTKATEIRREAGLDAARAVLGHRTSAITKTYAELDLTKAVEVINKLG